MTPEVWEVFDGMESKGFVKNFKNQKSDLLSIEHKIGFGTSHLISY